MFDDGGCENFRLVEDLSLYLINCRPPAEARMVFRWLIAIKTLFCNSIVTSRLTIAIYCAPTINSGHTLFTRTVLCDSQLSVSLGTSTYIHKTYMDKHEARQAGQQRQTARQTEPTTAREKRVKCTDLTYPLGVIVRCICCAIRPFIIPVCAPSCMHAGSHSPRERDAFCTPHIIPRKAKTDSKQ